MENVNLTLETINGTNCTGTCYTRVSNRFLSPELSPEFSSSSGTMIDNAMNQDSYVETIRNIDILYRDDESNSGHEFSMTFRNCLFLSLVLLLLLSLIVGRRGRNRVIAIEEWIKMGKDGGERVITGETRISNR